MTDGRRQKIALRKMEEMAKARKERHDRLVKPVVYKIGDYVLLRSHFKSSAAKDGIKKFLHYYLGPFKIIKIVHPNSVELQKLNGEKYF